MSPIKIRLAERGVEGMTKPQLDKFLESGRMILRVATVDEKGHPVIHPVWYYYQNDRVYMFSSPKARKISNIEKNDNIYFSVDTEAMPNKGVKGKGKARIVRDRDRSIAHAEKIVRKYMDDKDLTTRYGKSMLDYVKSGKSVVVEITPSYYTVWDYSKIMG